MILIPAEKKIRQINKGDVFGEVLASFNLDLVSNPGTWRITRMLKNTDSSVSNFGLPAAMKYFSTSAGEAIYAICGARMFKNGGEAEGAFTEDATAGAPTNLGPLCDLCVFNDYLYISSASTNIYKLSLLNVYSNFSAGTGAALLNKLFVYANRMYKVNASTSIISWDTADTVATAGNQNAIQLSADNPGNITFAVPDNNRIWIGTLNANGIGKIYDWDGVRIAADASYPLGNAGAVAGVIYRGILHFLDYAGVLYSFSSGTFTEVARFPLGGKLLEGATSPFGSTPFIQHNGMIADEDEILMNIKGTMADGSVNENMPSGIWAYSPENGLYHKYSFSLRNYTTGTQLDFGQVRVSKVGALAPLNFSDNTDGSLLAGAEYYSDATTAAQGIFLDHVLDTIQKAGIYVIPRIEAQNKKDLWKMIRLIFKKLSTSTDKIVVKYKTTEDTPTEATITWTNSTTFTTLTDVSAYVAGDEVQIVNGVGSGLCAHISSISESGGTYTVVLDETFAAATGSAKAWFSKWIKLDDVNYTDDSEEQTKDIGCGAASPSIYFKFWFLWTGKQELRKILIDNQIQE